VGQTPLQTRSICYARVRRLKTDTGLSIGTQRMWYTETDTLSSLPMVAGCSNFVYLCDAQRQAMPGRAQTRTSWPRYCRQGGWKCSMRSVSQRCPQLAVEALQLSRHRLPVGGHGCPVGEIRDLQIHELWDPPGTDRYLGDEALRRHSFVRPDHVGFLPYGLISSISPSTHPAGAVRQLCFDVTASRRSAVLIAMVSMQRASVAHCRSVPISGSP